MSALRTLARFNARVNERFHPEAVGEAGPPGTVVGRP
jgi:hypothetical protein